MKKLIAIIVATVLWFVAFVILAKNGSGHEIIEEKVCSATQSSFVRPRASASLVEPVFTMKKRVLGMIKEAGYDPIVAEAVIQCESGWKPYARGDGNTSWGLWQIHQPAHNLGTASFDPYLSTKYAIKLLESERGFNHWTCYKKITQL